MTHGNRWDSSGRGIGPGNTRHTDIHALDGILFCILFTVFVLHLYSCFCLVCFQFCLLFLFTAHNTNIRTLRRDFVCSVIVLYPHFFDLIVLAFAICPYCTTQTSMPPAGFEFAVPASCRLQSLALDRSATGTGSLDCIGSLICMDQIDNL